jgi:hypothetical protein
MKSTDDILSLYRQRVTYYGPLQAAMRHIQAIYHNAAEIPLPDMDRSETPSVPNLLAQGVDQMAGRITSVVPTITFSSMKPGMRTYDRRASDAARTIQGWWESDRLPLKMKQRGRHLIAYAMAPNVMRWDPKDHRPTWHTRHPLETFPSTDLIPGQMTPIDCIFAYRRSAGWMRTHGYTLQLQQLTNQNDTPNDTSILLLEYIDADECVLLAVHYTRNDSYMYADMDQTLMRAIERWDNGFDECPVTIPSRISLDGRQGQFDTMIGMYYQQARLMALETIAVEKGIFPDTYLVSRPGETGRFLDGPHDGRTGMVNVIAGGDIREVQSQPSYLTTQTVDRLERNQRVTAGIPAEFGGESGSNIRTGRRGDAVLSAVIDYPVAEAQQTFAYSLQEENEIAIQLAKKYDGDSKRTIYVGTGNARRPVTYMANETFETDEHTVAYPAAGSDLNSLIIGLGQRVGLGYLSRQSAAQLDPFIDNPETEHDLIISEGLEAALMQAIQQKAASGELPPLALSKIMTLVANDKMELAEAMNKVTEDALAEQQAQQNAANTQTTPEQAMAGGAVNAMAGPQSPIPGASPGQTSLEQLLSTVRRPGQMQQQAAAGRVA